MQKSSHKIGVVLLHVGPGVTNAVTGVVNAAMDSSAMLVISTNVPRYHCGKGALQDIMFHSDMGQIDLYKPFVKRAWRVDDAHQVVDVFSKAFNLALTGRPGPTLVDIPMDVQSADCSEEITDLKRRRPTGTKTLGDVAEIERALELFVNSERPVIYAGGGVLLSSACDELFELADLLGVPVATSLQGKGAFPENHELSLGTTGIGGSRPANQMTRQADCILAVGTHFEEWNSSCWDPRYTFSIPPTKLIHVDIDSREIGRIYPVEVGIVGDARAILGLMLDRVRRRKARRNFRGGPWYNQMVGSKREWQAEIAVHQNADGIPIHPSRVIKAIRDVFPEDSLVVTDVGWSKNCTGQQFPVTLPMTHIAGGNHFGTMGFGAAAAIGAKLGQPSKRVVCITGDGGFSASLPVLATAAELSLPVIWVVLNNFEYAAISTIMETAFGRAFGTKFSKQPSNERYNPDFARIAEAHGIAGMKVETPQELQRALSVALSANGPCVVDVVVDPKAPSVRPGHWDIFDRALRAGMSKPASFGA